MSTESGTMTDPPKDKIKVLLALSNRTTNATKTNQQYAKNDQKNSQDLPSVHLLMKHLIREAADQARCQASPASGLLAHSRFLRRISM
jgi:hypothetical protein